MLLETLDIKQNDILIYSQNIFDLENNFKIIFKDDPEKKARKINYSDVCRFVNEYTPKNLIVYRLLTNIPDFEIFQSKYGFFININSVTELIYFDPVFAVKELEEYSESLNYDLRFRIQQVGLTTLNRFRNLPNFAEIYSVDMMAIEAKNQNDKVFADAIFSVEREVQETKKKEPQKTVKQQEPRPLRKNTEDNTILKKEALANKTENEYQYSTVKEKEEKHPAADSGDIRFIHHDLSEDKDFDYKQILKINFKGATSGGGRQEGRPAAAKAQPAPAQKETSFGRFLQSKQINKGSEDHLSLGDLSQDDLTDFVKSPSSLKNVFHGRENMKVVLKLDKNQ